MYARQHPLRGPLTFEELQRHAKPRSMYIRHPSDQRLKQYHLENSPRGPEELLLCNENGTPELTLTRQNVGETPRHIRVFTINWPRTQPDMSKLRITERYSMIYGGIRQLSEDLEALMHPDLLANTDTHDPGYQDAWQILTDLEFLMHKAHTLVKTHGGPDAAQS